MESSTPKDNMEGLTAKAEMMLNTDEDLQRVMLEKLNNDSGEPAPPPIPYVHIPIVPLELPSLCKVDVFQLEAPIQGTTADMQAQMPAMHTGIGLRITDHKDVVEFLSFDMAATAGLTATMLPPPESIFCCVKNGSAIQWKNAIGTKRNAPEYQWLGPEVTDQYWVQSTLIFSELGIGSVVESCTIKAWTEWCDQYPAAHPNYRFSDVVCEQTGNVVLAANTCGTFAVDAIKKLAVLCKLSVSDFVNKPRINTAVLYVQEQEAVIADAEDVRKWAQKCLTVMQSTSQDCTKQLMQKAKKMEQVKGAL